MFDRLALAGIVLCIGDALLHADLTITCNGQPVCTGSDLDSATQMLNIDAADATLQGLDPGASAALNASGITFGILPEERVREGFDAMSDGDTVLVSRDILEDLDATLLASVLSHEADHLLHGPLGPCQHAGAEMDSGTVLDALIRESGNLALCDQFHRSESIVARLLADCAAENGVPTRADGSPLPDWPPPGALCQ